MIVLRLAALSAAIFAVTLGASPAHAASPPTPIPSPPAPLASASPPAAPRATASPSGFRYSGQLRAFSFVRQNDPQNAANPNRTAFLPGGTLHTEYWLPKTGLRVATSYTGADPFDVNGPAPQYNGKVDDSLPGFSLSTFDEAYVAYTNPVVDASVGDRFYNFIWMPSSDTRIKAVAYQGGDVNIKPVPVLDLGVSRILRFENRTSSAFTANTLLTSVVAGNAAPPIVVDTPGALHLYAFATLPRATIRVEHYDFFDLATLDYADARVAVAPNSRYRPFVAAQYVSEHDGGRALLGRIDDDTLGAAVGVDATRGLTLVFGLDSSPGHAAVVSATSAAAAARGFFVPSGGSGSVVAIGQNRYRVAYGGIASPYSDGYTGDPLYTTSISQGMVERRSPGTSYKLTATYLTPNRRFKTIVSAAYYDFDDAVAKNRTFQNDTDLQYFFDAVPVRGPYHGLSVRERVAHRSEPTVPYDFKYLRTQLEYDF